MIPQKFLKTRYANQCVLRWMIWVWLGTRAVCESLNAFESNRKERFQAEYGEFVLAPVEVFGKSYSFALNTGATTTLLDNSLRDQLGAPLGKVVLKTSAGVQTLDKHHAPPLKVGDSEFQSKGEMVCTDLTAISLAMGIPIHGMLGMDFLKSRILHINCDDGTAELLVDKNEEPGHIERIRFENNCPRISLWLPDEGFISCLIDTGKSNVLSLEPKLYDALVTKGHIVPRSNGLTAAIGQAVRIERGILRSIKLGPYPLFNVSVVKSTQNAVGMLFLSKFDSTLDFPNETAHFIPGKRYLLPDDRDRSGLAFGRREENTYVHDVEHQGPADQADIRAGDLLLEFDGSPADTFRLSEIQSRLCQKGAAVQLKLERNGVPIHTKLSLSNAPDPFPAELPRRTAKPFPDLDE